MKQLIAFMILLLFSCQSGRTPKGTQNASSAKASSKTKSHTSVEDFECDPAIEKCGQCKTFFSIRYQVCKEFLHYDESEIIERNTFLKSCVESPLLDKPFKTCLVPSLISFVLEQPEVMCGKFDKCILLELIDSTKNE